MLLHCCGHLILSVLGTRTLSITDRMISVHFQGKPFNITVIQAYAPTSNAEEAEVEWFYKDLQDLTSLRCYQLGSPLWALTFMETFWGLHLS